MNRLGALACRRGLIDIAILGLTLFVPLLARGQCSTSATVTAPDDPRGYGAAVTLPPGGNVGFELILNGVYWFVEGRTSTSGEEFFTLECRGAGDHEWRITATCLTGLSANHHSGTFSIPALLPRFDVTVLSIPDPLGNVRVDYEIHPAGRAAIISVVGVAGAQQFVPNGAGTVFFNVPPGTYKVRGHWCVNWPNSSSQEVSIHVASSGPPPTVVFNAPPTDRVLIRKTGPESFPSASQSADGKVRVSAVVRSSTGTPVPNKAVHLRLIDPPDTSAYTVQAGNTHVPNHNGPGTVDGAATALVVSNAAGAVSVELEVAHQAAGDNYQIQATTDSTFSCTLAPCTTSTVYTAWKRVYVEIDRMFTSGAFLTRDVPSCPASGCPSLITIHVSDARAVARAAVPGSQLRLIHAPRLDSTGPQTFYYDDVDVLSVDRRNNTLEISPVSRPYFGPELNPFEAIPTLAPFLADAVGVVTGNPADDYSSANTDNVIDLFTPAFVEYLWVTDDPAPYVPFSKLVTGLGADDEEVALLAYKWFHHRNKPNHLHLLSGREEQPDNPGQKILGRTRARLGTNWSWIWVQSVIDSAPRRNNSEWRFNGEVTAHEVAHLWQVNPPVTTTGGHCGTSRLQTSPRAFDDPNRFCVMHGTYSGSDCGTGPVRSVLTEL